MDHQLPPAVILAGGQGRRLGGVDKAFVPLGRMRLIGFVLMVIRRQVAALAISANGDPSRFDFLALPVLPDSVPGSVGPLAGVLAAMDWAKRSDPAAEQVLTVPVDCPLLPSDLVARLLPASGGGRIAIAKSGGRWHPTVALWPLRLAETLRAGLLDGSLRRLETFVLSQPHAIVEWPVADYDPFMNINTPADLAAAEPLVG